MRDEAGMVKGLWFEKKKVNDVLSTKAKAIYNTCIVAKDKHYLKLLFESNCKVLVDAVLGNSIYPWLVTTIVEYIKIFVDDYPHVSLYWVDRLANIYGGI